MFRAPEVILVSNDVERSAAFYASIGFVESYRSQSAELRSCRPGSGRVQLGIASMESTRDDHGLDPVADGQRAAVVLWTDDVDGAFETMTAEGCPALAPPHIWLDRLKIAWIADPDGHPIQIVQSMK